MVSSQTRGELPLMLAVTTGCVSTKSSPNRIFTIAITSSPFSAPVDMPMKVLSECFMEE